MVESYQVQYEARIAGDKLVRQSIKSRPQEIGVLGGWAPKGEGGVVPQRTMTTEPRRPPHTTARFQSVQASIYFGARYLDPKLGRWLSEDPAMDGMNWYSYVHNNPQKYVDPTGLEGELAEENRSAFDTWVAQTGRAEHAARSRYEELRSTAHARDSVEYAANMWRFQNGDLDAFESTTPGFKEAYLNHQYYAEALQGARHALSWVEAQSTLGNSVSTGDITQIAHNAANAENQFSGIVALAVGIGMYYRPSISTSNVPTVVKPRELTGDVALNFNRFMLKIPSNSRGSVTIQLLNDGRYVFSATSPGRVPGSSATYQKWVNSAGTTVDMLKTTVLPDGTIAHVKSKM